MEPSTLLALVFGAMVAVVNADDVDVVVDIHQGRLSGVAEETLKGRRYYAFRSIPYARPPVGPLRFKDPEPAEGWPETRDASSYPPRCVQTLAEGLILEKVIVDGDEDCLYLNVYTPETTTHRKYPVMVFIHGGAFSSGHSSPYGPTLLLDHDVILVVLQYRLGIFGFLSTEDFVIPGNFGLKDQTLALRWIHKNIAFFGGDPEMVTLIGESAGAASLMIQMLVPQAKGLFARGIIQSGSALHDWALGDSHARYSRRIGQTVNCPIDEGSENYLKCMQEVPADLLLHTVADLRKFFFLPAHLLPRVDGTYLRDHPAKLVERGQYHKVPVLAGTTAHEGALFTNYVYRWDERRRRYADDITLVAMSLLLDEELPEVQEEIVRKVLDHYVGEFKIDNDTADAVTQIISDGDFNVAQDITVLLLSRHQPVYYYELRHRGQLSFGDYANTTFSRRWVQHADELFYLFGSKRMRSGDREKDLRLSDNMTSLWTNFAKTGNPTPDDTLGFKWDSTKETSLRHLVLQPKPFMEDDFRKEIRDFWLQFPKFKHLRRFLHVKEEL
ncbi:juvenile hormone esterase-like [Oratosquilla oratoria]|uniref:juvenile hormone esterase-like n=1 Tax=Oratosquilla oratoria TaxID=337810 RepID=UPI003F7586F0